MVLAHRKAGILNGLKTGKYFIRQNRTEKQNDQKQNLLYRIDSRRVVGLYQRGIFVSVALLSWLFQKPNGLRTPRSGPYGHAQQGDEIDLSCTAQDVPNRAQFPLN